METNERKKEFEKLTPVCLSAKQKEEQNYSAYEEMLDYAMAEDDLHNIAISGSYGAGKSTLLNTYEQDHADNGKKFLHVSLAHFSNEKEQSEKLEIKILNQIIHQIDPKTVPQTRFKLKETVAEETIRQYSVWLIGLAVAWGIFSLLFHLTTAMKYKWENNILYTAYLGLFVCIAVMGYFGYLLLLNVVRRQLHKPMIKNIKLGQGEIILDESKDSSQFDKYMDEIIYLFWQAGIDVLVLEDMDRFDDVGIFNKLKEMNFLINQRRHSPVKFVYMIRDDLFEKREERTKFFDFIIPVVPVMDSSNSIELLVDLMQKHLPDLITKENLVYWRKICFYVKDYRLLKNICNEFLIFYEQLGVEKHGFDVMKCFVMVVYKNMLPEDYELLRQKDGYVYSILESKTELVAAVKEQLRERQQTLKQQIAQLFNDYRQKIRQLDTENSQLESWILQAFSSTLPWEEQHAEHMTHNLSEQTAILEQELAQIDKAETLIQGGDLTESEEMQQDEESEERLFTERGNYVNQRKRLDLELKIAYGERTDALKEYSERIRMLDDMSVRQLMNLYDVSDIPKKYRTKFLNRYAKKHGSSMAREEQQAYDMLDMFIRDGKIDKDYAFYMTYFYPNTLTEEEQAYLNRIYNRKQGDVTIPVSNMELIFDSLEIGDYESRGILNDGYISYLLKTERKQELGRIVTMLRSEHNISYVVHLFDETEQNKPWLQTVEAGWPDYIEELILNETITLEQKADHVCWYLYLAPDEEEEKKREILEAVTAGVQSASTAVGIFIQNNAELFLEKEFSEDWRNKVFEEMAKLHVKFPDITSQGIPKENRQVVYKWNMYTLEQGNLAFFLEQEGLSERQIQEENYLSVTGCQGAVNGYVRNNLESYVNNVYLPHYVRHAKKEEELLLLLNTGLLTDEKKKQLILAMPEETTIGNFLDVQQDSLWNPLVQADRIAFGKENILEYWQLSKSVDGSLEAYLKIHYKTEGCGLAYQFMKDYMGADKANAAVDTFILLEHLLEEKQTYLNLLKDLRVRYISFPKGEYTEELVKVWIEKDLFWMTKQTLSEMCESYPALLKNWVEKKPTVYLNLLKGTDERGEQVADSETLIQEDELLEFMEDKAIDEGIRCQFVKLCEHPISIKDSYTSKMIEAVLDNGLFDGKIDVLMRKYGGYSGSLKKRLITVLGVEQPSTLITYKGKLPQEFFKGCLENGTVLLQNKQLILAGQIAYMKWEEIKEQLRLLQCDWMIPAVENGKNPKKPVGEALDAVQGILAGLQRKSLISSYKVEAGYYYVYAKKKRKNKKS